MGPTRLLTNIIQRKVMLPEEMSPSMQRDNFEVALTDFEKHSIIKCLFKADNVTRHISCHLRRIKCH